MAKTEDFSTTRLKDRIEHSILQSRRLLLSGPIDSELADVIIQKLWYLELEAPGKPILLVINSPGGSVDAGFAIWDQIKMLTSPVSTLVTGMAASMGSILSLVAPKGRRYATPYSRIMIHQPAISGMIPGQASDLEIQAREILKTKKVLIELYVAASGQTYEKIEKAIDRDTWMSVEEAKQFGLLDHIVSSYKDIKE